MMHNNSSIGKVSELCASRPALMRATRFVVSALAVAACVPTAAAWETMLKSNWKRHVLKLGGGRLPAQQLVLAAPVTTLGPKAQKATQALTQSRLAACR